jgi:hypothetical protein
MWFKSEMTCLNPSIQALSALEEVLGVLKSLSTRLYAESINSREGVPGESGLNERIDRKENSTKKTFPDINRFFIALF